MPRRRLEKLIALAAAVVLGVTGCSVPAPAPDVVPSSTVGQGATVDLGKALDEHRAGLVNLQQIRAVLVSRRGQLVAERYYDREASEYADVWSVTKSVVSTLVGIALAKGELRSTDQTLAELLPQHRATMAPASAKLRLRDLLTMTAGWTWDWDPDPGRKNLVARTLAHGPDGKPGTFSYVDIGPHVVAAVLVTATGKPLLEYAREELFEPLGIDSSPAAEPPLVDAVLPAVTGLDQFRWARDPDGIHGGGYGLALTARDLVKIGDLWSNQGEWQGRRLLDPAFVAEATRNQIPERESDRYGYGYLWWYTPLATHSAYMAQGLYGQMIMVVPDLDLVVVVTSDGSGPPEEFDGIRAFDDLRALVDTIVVPNLPA